jgi:hypothetical protein
LSDGTEESRLWSNELRTRWYADGLKWGGSWITYGEAPGLTWSEMECPKNLEVLFLLTVERTKTLSAISVYENTKVINRGIALLGLEFVNITIEDAE